MLVNGLDDILHLLRSHLLELLFFAQASILSTIDDVVDLNRL